jgi:GDPmannose 4,6-dehydratase
LNTISAVLEASEHTVAGPGLGEFTRDWGWAPECVDAMARVIEFDEPQDFVIATGTASTLGEFV